MDLKAAYIWLDVIEEELEKDVAPDSEIECIKICKAMIREKITGFADEKVK